VKRISYFSSRFSDFSPNDEGRTDFLASHISVRSGLGALRFTLLDFFSALCYLLSAILVFFSEL
jgi:hypothetical protein